MESMCNKSNLRNENKISENEENEKNISRSESPVFKCFNPKPTRTTRVDSSDYDIPSYQINQSAKSKTSIKSENSDSFLPFTPNFSPILPTVQFQPPSIHSLGTVFKSMKQTSNNFSDKQPFSKKGDNVFENLGMTDKDISWVSSMASPPPQVPRSEFNTIEKATFFPEEKFQNIQPRALFSPTRDDDFGCKPLSFSSESEDDEAYKTNIRLSDVCATLKQLEMKSIDQIQPESNSNNSSQSSTKLSPVIRTKKKKCETKRKLLVSSPDDKYKFSVGESVSTPNRTNSSGSVQNFIEDDSFQSMSFSCLDELCKTLVNSSTSSKSVDCDKTITNQNEIVEIPKSDVKKCFYTTKSKANIQEVTTNNNFYSYVKALEEGNVTSTQLSKIEKSFTKKGIIRLDELNTNGKTDAVKRLHPDEEHESKFKKLKPQENFCNWEEEKDLCHSQHSISDSEIFRTVENLEKTLVNQEFDKSKTVIDKIGSSIDRTDGVNQPSSNLSASVSTNPLVGFSTASGSKLIISEKALAKAKKEFEKCIEEAESNYNLNSEIGFSCASGKKIKVSLESLEKAKKLMSDCGENDCEKTTENETKSSVAFEENKQLLSYNKFESTKLEKLEVPEKQNKYSKIRSSTPLKEVSDLEEKSRNFVFNFSDKLQTSRMNWTNKVNASTEYFNSAVSVNFPFGFSTAIGTNVNALKESIEKTRTLINKDLTKECTNAEEGVAPLLGFSTAAGTTEQEALEEDKALISKESIEVSTKPKVALMPMVGFSTAAGTKVNVSKEALDKANALLSKDLTEDCTEAKKPTTPFLEFSTEFTEESALCGVISSTNKIPPVGFSIAAGTKVNVSKEALEKGLMFEDTTEVCTKVEKPTVPLLGFSTAAGTKVNVSKEALEKARALMSQEELKSTENVKSGKETNQYFTDAPTEPPSFGFLTAAGTKVNVSKEALEKAKALISKEFAEENFSSEGLASTNIPLPGFSTAAGTKVNVSKEALDKAKELIFTESEVIEKKHRAEHFVKAQEPKMSLPGFSTAAVNKVNVSKETVEKAKVLMSKDITHDCSAEKVPLLGFSTAAGTKVSVSLEALEKAKTLMSEKEIKFTGDISYDDKIISSENLQIETLDEAKELLKKNNLSSAGTLRESNSDSTNFDSSRLSFMGFSTALGNRIKVSAEAFEKAKTLMSENENLNKSNTQSLSDFSKQNYLRSEVTQENNVLRPVDSRNENFKENSSVLNNTKEDGSVTKPTITEDDWDEIIPSWLHVYTTSPSMVSDRTNLIPLVCDEEEKSTTIDREYIVKSPVFGSHDRFTKKRKRKKLDFECEPKPQPSPTSCCVNTKNKKTSVKRTSSCLSLDFSAPFKRMKSEEHESNNVVLNVKEERTKARAEQEKIIKEKQKVKPVKGSHLLRKKTEKQLKWVEAVKATCPEVYSNEYLKNMHVKEEILNVNVVNAVDFKFNLVFFGSNSLDSISFQVRDGCVLIPDDDNKLGVEEFKNAFLASPGVQPNLLPLGWLENHYKWIVWKLSHYEKSFPQFFGGKCLTPQNVVLQLKYRYDREIDGSERSALKKILERDDTPMKRLVLCVCGIKKVERDGLTDYRLSLTDGWYSCPARADPAMVKLVESGKVKIGTKLVTQGAALINCEQGISPLEVNEDIYLKISTNSTRRVRWDTKLGYQKNPGAIAISLSSVLPQGGNISCLNVIVVRVYPMLYMEKTSDGCHVTRNLRSEEKAEADHQKIQEKRMEAILNEINLEMEKLDKIQKKKFENSENLTQLMENNSDPSGESMTISQRESYQNLISNRNDRRTREIREKIEQKLKNEKLGKRNVSEFFRVRIVDLRRPDYNNPATLSIWNPNEEVFRVMAEGKAVAVTNISVGSSSRSYKQLNTTRSTHFREINKSIKYPGRKLTHLKDVSSKACPAFEEVDIVGVVTKMQEVAHGSRLSQVVYLTDLDFNFVGILFWGSSKNYGWENVLKMYSTVACSNLLWKKNFSVQEVPLLHVNESSVFTENPKHSYLKEELERLKTKIPQDKNSFFAKFDEELTVKLEESKWKNNSNRSSIGNDSSLSRSRLGDGFETKPSASSTPIKSFSSALMSNEAEPSPIQKRIEKLQSYGEPPPLLPLILANRERKMKRKS